MTFEFRPAVREQTALLIAFAGPSGGGKTLSALRLARGLVGPNGKIAGIDTEARRMLHYAGEHKFDHAELMPPFSPAQYIEAIKAGEALVGNEGAVIIDSMSHEHEGEGGLLDMQLAALDRMAGEDYGKRERLSASAWREPKLQHKRMMNRLLQLRCHVIFCLRAEEKIKFVKGEDGKTRIVPMGWQPICEKRFMYEMTASFMLLDALPGVPQPIKLQDQHKAAFPQGQLVSEESGAALAAWARGGKVAEPPPQQRDWSKFGTTMTERVNAIEDVARLDSLIAHNAAHLEGYKEWSADKWSDLMALVAARKTELLNRENV